MLYYYIININIIIKYSKIKKSVLETVKTKKIKLDIKN